MIVHLRNMPKPPYSLFTEPLTSIIHLNVIYLYKIFQLIFALCLLNNFKPDIYHS